MSTNGKESVKNGHDSELNETFAEDEQHTDTKISVKATGKTLVKTQTKFQKMVILENKWWGKMLILDDWF